MRNSILKFIFPAFIILLSWSYALAQPYDRKAVSARQATIAQITKIWICLILILAKAARH